METKKSKVIFINKKLLKTEDIEINKILVSKAESYGTKNSLKYFIEYNDDDAIRPLFIKLPKMIGYVKHFDSNKAMSFKVINKKPLKECTKIWEKVSNLMNITFDSEPVCGDNDKYIKTKIKLYGNTVNTNFQKKTKKRKKENASYRCLSLIMLDSVIRANKKHYPQTLLEQCKHVIRKNKMEDLINDGLDLNSSDESDNKSDNEFDNGSGNDEN